MTQIKTILERLKNPSVLMSILAQITSLLILFQIHVDMNLVNGVMTAVSSILILLGILSDPNTQKKGYGDDIMTCADCGETGVHYKINGKMTCKNCGNQIEK
ncbi:MAG: phage holin [Evtepia sp.]